MPPVSLALAPAFSITYTIGVLEIGTFVAIFLFGLVTGQVYVYFSRSANDPLGLKVLVGLVWALDLGHTVAISNSVYTVTIVARPDPMDGLPISLDIAIILSGLIGLLEQGWFAYRLHKFSKRLALPILCCTLSVLRLAGSIGLSTIALRRLPLPEFESRVGWLITAILSVGVSIDFVLTVTLCYHLRYWTHGGFRRLTSQLITWTLETGSITMCGAISLLVTFLTLKNTFIWIGCFVVLSKLSSTSLLLSLNSRARFGRIVEEIMSANARTSPPPVGDIPLALSPALPSDVHPTQWLQEFPRIRTSSGRPLYEITEEEASSGTGTLVQTPTTSIAFGSPRVPFSSSASKDKEKDKAAV
ncbi:hypothetical protein FB451DRAFT_1443560 [Mycena latifolia]|nr:hypothetical protein FB451DRAFT_1443560 [Mycena latifolia]